MNKKQLIRMTKPHSAHEILFTVDVDPHFMNIEVKKRATGATVCQHYILRSDLPRWISMYEGDKFEITTNNEYGKIDGTISN